MPVVRLRVNAPHVIHESFDGDVVVIKLATGVYYSLTDTAAEIWDLLEAGVTSDQLPAFLADRYEQSADAIAGVVSEFVGELCADELMIPDGAIPSGKLPTSGAAACARTAFRAPRLDRFTDMQHLITLDPIHDVDEEQGWPHTR
ncbi:MAG: PqqD family protein [Chloroflexi bacterium]|nr:MAG: PqqD family protein [Chloroflexota bacterium]